MGDFNSVMDPELDRSHGGISDSLTKKVKGWMEEYGGIHIWRRLHATKREFTFFQGNIIRFPE